MHRAHSHMEERKESYDAFFTRAEKSIELVALLQPEATSASLDSLVLNSAGSGDEGLVDWCTGKCRFEHGGRAARRRTRRRHLRARISESAQARRPARWARARRLGRHHGPGIG